jgi:tetratricopeptide (TPR) repeat protein
MNNVDKLVRKFFLVGIVVVTSMLAAGCGKMRMARHEQHADKYFADGDYARAEVEYLNVLRFSRTNAHAVARLGTIYDEQGCPGRAYPYLSKACEFYPNDLDLRLKLAIIQVRAQQYKEAQDNLSLILDKLPSNARAPALLTETVMPPADAGPVRKRLEALHKQLGDTAPLELSFGQLDIWTNDFKSAEAAFKRAQALDPKSSAVFFTLGNFYISQNRLKEADEALKTAAGLSGPRSLERLGYANFKITSGDLEEGKRLLDEITKAAPDYVPAWISEAQIAMAQKRYDDCSTLLQRALGEDPGNYDALLMQGRLYLAQGHPDKAAVDFQQMATQYTRSSQAQFHLALARLAQGDVQNAVSSLNQALAIDPNYADAAITLAELDIRRGDPAGAVKLLSPLVRKQPQFAQAQLILAKAYFAQNDLDNALAIYSKLEEQLPKNPQIQLMAGLVLARQNKLSEARKSFEKALEVAPHFPEAIEQLVNLDIVEKQYASGLAHAQLEMSGDTNGVASQLLQAKVHVARAEDTAIKLHPGSTDLKLSNIPEAREDVDQAEAELLKAISGNPNVIASHFMLAELYVATGKGQAALSHLTELAGKTNSVAVYMEIGKINDALTNYPAARDGYEKVLEIDPNFSPALNNLAYLYSARLGQLDKAFSLAQKARQLLPDDPSTADTLGWILYQRGDYSGAVSLLERSVAKLGAQPEIQLHLAMTRYMLGQEDAARDGLAQAVKSPRDFPGKADASRRLAILAVDSRTADAKTVAQLESWLRDNPNDPIASLRLAAIYERDGAREKAVGLYEQALKANSQNAEILGHLAQLYSDLNNSGKALESAKQAHNVAPDNAIISWTLGRLVYRSGDYAWALSLLQDAADKLPAQREVDYDLAWALYSLGKVQDAENSMQQAIPALSGGNLEDAKCFLAMLGAARTSAPSEQVTAQASQVLATNACYVPAIMVLAVQQEQQAKFDEAKKLYERAVTCYPAFPPAGRNLAVLAAWHPGDDEKAYEFGTKARPVFPNDADLAAALGLLAYRHGDYSQSVQFLKQNKDALNKNGQLLYYLGKSEYQLKQKQESKDAFQRALSLNLQADLAADARKLLAELK